MPNIQSTWVIKPDITWSLTAWKDYPINLLNSSNHFWDIPDFWVSWCKRFCPFLSAQQLLNKHLPFLNLYQYAKNIYIYIYIYILLILLWDLSTLCVMDHLWPLIYIYIYIFHMYIIYIWYVLYYIYDIMYYIIYIIYYIFQSH